MISQNTFCANPWLQFRINADGSVTYCSRITDDSYEQTGSDFFTEFNDNPEIKNARKSFLLESPNVLKGCFRCFYEEQHAIGKFRELQNLQSHIVSGKYFLESVKQSELPQKINADSFYPRHVFVKFNNQCNLSCRMCMPKSSNKLNQLYKTHQYSGYEEKFDLQRYWTEDEKIWESFLKITVYNPELDTLQFNGGEPLLERSTYKILQCLLDHGKQHVKINIASNVTEYSVELMELLKNFSHVTMDMSVETFDEINDYIRYPSKFQNIKNNIEQYLTWDHYENLNFGVHLTPQIYSIDNLYTVLDFVDSRNMFVTCNKVWPQKFLDFSILPLAQKQRLRDFYSTRYRHAKNNSVKSAAVKLVQWLSLPDSADSESLKKQFIKYTKDHDIMMGANFLDYFPQYEDFFNSH